MVGVSNSPFTARRYSEAASVTTSITSTDGEPASLGVTYLYWLPRAQRSGATLTSKDLGRSVVFETGWRIRAAILRPGNSLHTFGPIAARGCPVLAGMGHPRRRRLGISSPRGRGNDRAEGKEATQNATCWLSATLGLCRSQVPKMARANLLSWASLDLN